MEPEEQLVAKRTVAENTEAGRTVGSPVPATDEDGDTLTYTLTGVDAGLFSIDWGTGQIMTKGDLDAEAEGVGLDKDEMTDGIQLTVVVRATDPSGIPGAATCATDDPCATVTVMITVTDVKEAPVVTGDAEVDFDEVAGSIATELYAYEAVDPDDDSQMFTWSVGGADGSKFNIGNETAGTPGQLKFKVKPDYEMPTDANTDNVYEVTVQASDGRLTGMRKVMVTVTNTEEDGVVTLSSVQPVVGIPVTASLDDPDGIISKLTWQWSDGDGDIPRATSDTYTPVAGDVGEILTATAMYFDGKIDPDNATMKKMMAGSSANMVRLDSRNKPPVFGDEDLDTEGVQNTMATRKVEENTEANAADDDSMADATDDNDNVGAAVTATDTKADASDETLTYSLGGADAAKFRVRQDGQIEVASGTELDYETKNT